MGRETKGSSSSEVDDGAAGVGSWVEEEVEMLLVTMSASQSPRPPFAASMAV